MSFLKNNLASQRGAMFGLDARIALAIMAALSIVAGASMVQILKDRRVDNLLFEQEKFASAVAAYQEDLETNIHDSLTTSNNTNAYMALVDSSLLTAPMQNRWLGPYLREYMNNNDKEYGLRYLTRLEDVITGACSATEIRSRQCFYYLVITLVPLATITELNTRLDGAEGTPANEGIVQWDTITANNARLYMRLGLVAP